MLRSLPLLALAGLAPAQDEPSFLVILADDLGRDAVGFTGAHPTPPPTPRLDQLAAEGVQLDRAYVSPLCSPTRAMLLTGRYAWRNGVGGNLGVEAFGGGLDLASDTLPHALGPKWRRVVLGKWHLSHPDQLASDPPTSLGYDEFKGSWFNLNPFGQTYTHWLKTVGLATFGQNVYATTDSVEDAIEELRTGRGPLFLMHNIHAPHSPFHKAPAHLAGPPPTLQTPDLYHTMVEAMDTEIGRLLDELAASPYAGSTWVIFLGDNGTPSPAIMPPLRPDKVKNSVYEGGIRVPMIVRGPSTQPALVDDIVHVCDLYATITELAGVPATTEDSISMVPILRGEPGARDHAYCEIFGPFYADPPNFWRRAVVGERYKLIERKGTGEEMYDLELDPVEERDILLQYGVDGLTGEHRRAYVWLRERMDAQGGGLYD